MVSRALRIRFLVGSITVLTAPSTTSAAPANGESGTWYSLLYHFPIFQAEVRVFQSLSLVSLITKAISEATFTVLCAPSITHLTPVPTTLGATPTVFPVNLPVLCQNSISH